MKFTKESFEKTYKPKKVKELYDPKTGTIGGDTVVGHGNITTDVPVLPADDSTDREKDISITTDKHVKNTRNTDANLYDIGQMGTIYGSNHIREDEESSKKTGVNIKKLVKELLSKRNEDSDIVNNTTNTDINLSSIPGLEKINDIALANKLNGVLTSIKSLNPEEKSIVINFLITNLDTNDIPEDYKNIIRKSL